METMENKVKNVPNYLKADQNYYDMITQVVKDTYKYEKGFTEYTNILRWK